MSLKNASVLLHTTAVLEYNLSLTFQFVDNIKLGNVALNICKEDAKFIF